MIVFENAVPFLSATVSATKLRVSAGERNLKAIRERERERERKKENSPLNTLSSSSANLFLSSLTTRFVTHGDCAPAFISFRWLSRGRGIVRPFLLRSVCGRRCRNFPRFLPSDETLSFVTESKTDERDLGFLNSGCSISPCMTNLLKMLVPLTMLSEGKLEKISDGWHEW